MPKVTLLAAPQHPEKIVAAAAKLCYSPVGVTQLMEGLTPEKIDDFVQMLAQIGHESPIEHINFTFAIEGVSRAFLAQMTRHRIASYSVQSQRYVGKYDFDYITPPQIAQNAQASQLFEQAMRQAAETYNQLVALLQDQQAQLLMQQGIPEKKARQMAEKKAMEDARFVLPNACDTRMIVTMNARSLLNFFAHRCCNRAQWEIHQVADEMLRLVFSQAPHLFAHAGPPCLRGGCPEGKMSCGQMQQVRDTYAQLKKEATR